MHITDTSDKAAVPTIWTEEENKGVFDAEKNVEWHVVSWMKKNKCDGE